MMRRYPLTASPQELASYVALGGTVIPEAQCIERAKSMASARSRSLEARLTSMKTPSAHLSGGWVLGWVLGFAAWGGFPHFAPFLTIILATATAATGLLGALLQLRPILAALNPRSAVSWFVGPFVSQEIADLGPIVDLGSPRRIAHDGNLHPLEYEHAPVGEGAISPVRAETKPHVHVGGSFLDRREELRALDSLSGLSLEIRGQLFRRRRDLFQDLARKLLPDVFVQASTIAVATVVAALALIFDDYPVQVGSLTVTWAAQLPLGIMVGRSVSSIFNTLSWWGWARQNWEELALEERLVIAAVAGVPDRVLSALAEYGRPIGGSFATPESAREWYQTTVLGTPMRQLATVESPETAPGNRAALPTDDHKTARVAAGLEAAEKKVAGAGNQLEKDIAEAELKLFKMRNSKPDDANST